ncbi:hypothetical protein LXL04_037148 [Taraxacum kok-saghyz]
MSWSKINPIKDHLLPILSIKCLSSHPNNLPLEGLWTNCPRAALHTSQPRSSLHLNLLQEMTTDILSSYSATSNHHTKTTAAKTTACNYHHYKNKDVFLRDWKNGRGKQNISIFTFALAGLENWKRETKIEKYFTCFEAAASHTTTKNTGSLPLSNPQRRQADNTGSTAAAATPTSPPPTSAQVLLDARKNQPCSDSSTSAQVLVDARRICLAPPPRLQSLQHSSFVEQQRNRKNVVRNCYGSEEHEPLDGFQFTPTKIFMERVCLEGGALHDVKYLAFSFGVYFSPILDGFKELYAIVINLALVVLFAQIIYARPLPPLLIATSVLWGKFGNLLRLNNQISLLKTADPFSCSACSAKPCRIAAILWPYISLLKPNSAQLTSTDILHSLNHRL